MMKLRTAETGIQLANPADTTNNPADQKALLQVSKTTGFNVGQVISIDGIVLRVAAIEKGGITVMPYDDGDS